MPTRITQIENARADTRTFKGGEGDDQLNSSDTESQATVLKVEGTLHLKDAELLEKICRDVAVQTGRPVMLDLASLGFIDSDSASVLCRLKQEQDVRLEGLHLFIEKVIELAEECEKASKYLPGEGDVTRTS
ncbi:MAG: STAS domain-containing protein [Pyrinomonadaceae bacterium]